MTIHDLSEKLGNLLSQTTGEQEKAPILAYGLELVISESLKLFVLLLITYFFGLLVPMLFILSTSFPFRLLTGGQHCSSSFRCMLTTILIFPTLAFLAQSASSFMKNTHLLAFVFITSVSVIVILEKYGPGYSINYPDPSPELKNRIKKQSSIFIIIWLIIVIILTNFVNNNVFFSIIVTSTAVGILWQGFLLTPIGHCFIKKIDMCLLLLKLK